MSECKRDDRAFLGGALVDIGKHKMTLGSINAEGPVFTPNLFEVTALSLNKSTHVQASLCRGQLCPQPANTECRLSVYFPLMAPLENFCSSLCPNSSSDFLITDFAVYSSHICPFLSPQISHTQLPWHGPPGLPSVRPFLVRTGQPEANKASTTAPSQLSWSL